MKLNAFIIAGIASLIAFASIPAIAQEAKTAAHPDTSAWKDLFAADLSNAKGAEHWKLQDEVLVAKHHNTLWTTAEYGDFVLDLEFKVEKESNSGVLLR